MGISPCGFKSRSEYENQSEKQSESDVPNSGFFLHSHSASSSSNSQSVFIRNEILSSNSWFDNQYISCTKQNEKQYENDAFRSVFLKTRSVYRSFNLQSEFVLTHF